jgi:hypothetical protein
VFSNNKQIQRNLGPLFGGPKHLQLLGKKHRIEPEKQNRIKNPPNNKLKRSWQICAEISIKRFGK